MVRCFVAIDIDDEAIVKRIVDIEKQLSATGAYLKLVEPQNLHITIRFLGEINEKEIPAISKVIARASETYKSFEILIEGIGAFPTINRPRVIWLGITDGSSTLKQLADAINLEIDKLGFRKDKPFVPHLTIARVKRYNSGLIRFINNYRGIKIGRFRVKEVRLKKSKLTSQGPIYTTLFSTKFE